MLQAYRPLPFGKQNLQTSEPRLNQITISSSTGAGKSTAIKRLKEMLEGSGFRFISASMIFRAKGKEHGMEVGEFAKYCKENPNLKIDEWCDQQIAQFKDEDKIIMEGRLGHLFLPRAFKVLLYCDLFTCAKRRANDEGKPVGMVLKEIDLRDSDDEKRYSRLYPGWKWSPSEYDLAIDTSCTPPDQVVEQIISTQKKWLALGNRFTSVVPASLSIFRQTLNEVARP